jgi:hypothetical protein
VDTSFASASHSSFRSFAMWLGGQGMAEVMQTNGAAAQAAPGKAGRASQSQRRVRCAIHRQEASE